MRDAELEIALGLRENGAGPATAERQPVRLEERVAIAVRALAAQPPPIAPTLRLHTQGKDGSAMSASKYQGRSQVQGRLAHLCSSSSRTSPSAHTKTEAVPPAHGMRGRDGLDHTIDCRQATSSQLLCTVFELTLSTPWR